MGEDFLHISMHAIVGINTFQAMRITGKVKKRPLHILIDSGSNHNFLDLATAKRVKCDVRNVVPLQLSVANGATLVSSAMCKEFTWSLHGESFSSDLMLVL